MAKRQELQDALTQAWATAQDSDGSRSGMQNALDEIQENILDVLPNVESLADNSANDEEDEEDEDD